MTMKKNHLLLTLSLFVLSIPASAPLHAEGFDELPHYAIALHGEPKYPENFTHVDFVNPDAPKGGTLRLSTIGTFDSLNPFIIKGTPADGINYLRSGLIYESLMQNAWDEPFTLYGVIAKSITVAKDKSWVRFALRPEAKWQDGKPITADDVKWTFETLTQKGQPFFKAYWNDVKEVIVEDEKTVRFVFNVSGNSELPLIIAEMSVLPKHYWTDGKHNFDQSSLEIPLGSGPYKIGKVEAGRSISFVRDPNWWGKDLAFFKGMNNFDNVTYEYYRDTNVAHESFLAGNYDIKLETTALTWQTGYNAPAVKDGRIKKEEIHNDTPAGMQGFIFNIRRPLFADPKVREALAYAFDFEWSNKQFAYSAYTRTNSYFDNSELASTGTPDAAELKILEAYRGKIPDQVFTEEYNPPKTDGSGNNRENIKRAIALLEEAGFTTLGKDGIRTKTNADGSIQKLQFEIIDGSPVFERWVMPFLKNLQRIGAKATFRPIDPAQYQNRMNSFDFDMTIGSFGQSASPGNEQREYWGSDRAEAQGSRNYIGIKNPVIDDLVTQIIHADSREDLVTKTRALDRILLWNHYVIPMWHYPYWRVAYWNTLQRPENLSGTSPLITSTWWHTPETLPEDAKDKK